MLASDSFACSFLVKSAYKISIDGQHKIESMNEHRVDECSCNCNNLHRRAQFRVAGVMLRGARAFEVIETSGRKRDLGKLHGGHLCCCGCNEEDSDGSYWRCINLAGRISRATARASEPAPSSCRASQISAQSPVARGHFLRPALI